VKEKIQHLLHQAVLGLQAGGILPESATADVVVDRARQKEHGDLASNIALVLAKQAGMNPRALAEAIVKALPASDDVVRTEIAGPGFINFFLRADAAFAVVPRILQAGAEYGHSHAGAGQKIQVEFVSANPTGPLHVGHGRGAAYGATVANLLETAGFSVHREYYVNDAGRQMDILAASVWLRYLELCGEELAFPSNGYRGDYVWDIAATVHREHGDALRHAESAVFANIPADAPAGGDKETHIDAVIARMRALLGADAYRTVHRAGLDSILDDIRRDLDEFGVRYDDWFSEHSLVETGAVTRAIERLRESGHLYEKDGALWFRSTDYGDEKDRVIVRDNGQHTYFAADIAYHMDKLDRGFNRVLDIWGADHHGYVPRVKAALAAMGEDSARLDVLLVQFAVLYRGGEKVQMSTRSGEFVTLRELRHEVGNDAARFFYVMRKSEQHLDFDLDLAKSQSNDNPVYYIQYAHARIHSVFRQMQEKGMQYDPVDGNANLTRLTESHEADLLAMLEQYPELLEQAALRHEPHQLVHYLRELANRFHTYYNAHTFLTADDALRNARLNLISATRQVIANGLALLGVSAPESM
jgi:arginyl-tRNA synthetase